MQVLHMKVTTSKKALTRDLIRYVLMRITEKANKDACNALRKSNCFLVGVWKADPRSHNPEYPALAEYTTGFIMCALALSGLYYLWVS